MVFRNTFEIHICEQTVLKYPGRSEQRHPFLNLELKLTEAFFS